MRQATVAEHVECDQLCAEAAVAALTVRQAVQCAEMRADFLKAARPDSGGAEDGPRAELLVPQGALLMCIPM